ncbi:uncharacterized protein LOC123364368 [Mauremys mutica]|uniref:uncharacterized protein LOC123364368 n=1 Tax=Mauremys mutica TaxID=74926 RepID=UPI001D167608|nr:uncharacterized protein LOC123364368 [Mauremys mutica]
MGDLCDMAVITHAFRLLTCPDPTVRSIAQEAVRGAVRKRIARAPSKRDVATYLSGSLEAEFGREVGDLSSLWSRARNASRRLGKRIGCCWKWCEARRELGILVPRVKVLDHIIVTPTARAMLERSLKDAIRCHYAENLKRKLDQGKVFKVSSKWDASNHFLPGAASPGSPTGGSSTGPDSTAFPSTEPSATATGTSSAGSAATRMRPCRTSCVDASSTPEPGGTATTPSRTG